MQFRKAFYEKHGIKITDEPVEKGKSAEQLKAERGLHDAVKRPVISSQTLELIEKNIKEYPNSEALKNYQYIAYIKMGQEEKGINCLHETIKLHPNYVFGLINLVNYHIDKAELDKASALLTEPYDVRRVEAEEFINYSVFINYYQTVVRLELAKKNLKKAEKYHRLMFDYDQKHKVVIDLAQEIMIGRLIGMSMLSNAPSVREAEAMSKVILGWEKSDNPPVFKHFEVENLYKFSTNGFPDDLIKEFLALPRTSLIKDLENVLADAVKRRDYYLTKEWDDKAMSFPVHALYLLTELRAYESLPTILNVLRQDQELLDFWFGDTLGEVFFPPIYILGNTQLPLLEAFITESNNCKWARNIASEVAAQTALRQPERRTEVVDWFKKVMQTHLDQADNDGLIDNVVLGSLVSDSLHFSGIELEPQITALFEKGWVSDRICGTLEEVIQKLQEPIYKYRRVNPLPASIYEMYTHEFSDEIENTAAQKLLEKEYLDSTNDPYNDFLINKSLSNMIKEKMAAKSSDYDDSYYAPPQETIKRVEPKVGRNDPCPCGSGKKYKKCHGA